MTKMLAASLRAWTQKPDEAYIRNLRLRAQSSPYRELSRRLQTAGLR